MTEHHERETVVIERDRGSGLATILGIIVVVALLVAVWYFTLGPGTVGDADRDAGTEGQNAPAVEAPTEAPAPS